MLYFYSNITLAESATERAIIIGIVLGKGPGTADTDTDVGINSHVIKRIFHQVSSRYSSRWNMNTNTDKFLQMGVVVASFEQTLKFGNGTADHNVQVTVIHLLEVLCIHHFHLSSRVIEINYTMETRLIPRKKGTIMVNKTLVVAMAIAIISLLSNLLSSISFVFFAANILSISFSLCLLVFVSFMPFIFVV